MYSILYFCTKESNPEKAFLCLELLFRVTHTFATPNVQAIDSRILIFQNAVAMATGPSQGGAEGLPSSSSSSLGLDDDDVVDDASFDILLL